jgi:hypothetical protein
MKKQEPCLRKQAFAVPAAALMCAKIHEQLRPIEERKNKIHAPI